MCALRGLETPVNRAGVLLCSQLNRLNNIRKNVDAKLITTKFKLMLWVIFAVGKHYFVICDSLSVFMNLLYDGLTEVALLAG